MTPPNKRTTPREHGTRAKYVVDKCRCSDCRKALRDYEAERRRSVPPYVSARAAREHVEGLMARGMGFKRIAQLAGVAPSGVAAILYGKKVGDKHRAPTRRIRPETEAALLAVGFDPNDGSYVDASDMWRQIDEMVAAGVPRTRIAERVGGSIHNMYTRRERARADRVRAVADMYGEFVDGTLVTLRRSRHGDRTLTFEARPLVKPDVDDVVARRAEYEQFVSFLAGVVEDRAARDWHQYAACLGHPPRVWFPTVGDHWSSEAARRICAGCGVRERCLTANLAQPFGIFGGMNVRERSELRAERNREVVA